MTRLLLFTSAAAVAAALAYVVPLPDVPLCAFKLWTGRPCPGCGMTRAVVSAAHGRLLASLRFHPLGIVLVGGVVAGWFGALVGAARGRDPVWRAFERRPVTLAAGFVTALVVLWVVRAFLVPSWAPDPIHSPAW